MSDAELFIRGIVESFHASCDRVLSGPRSGPSVPQSSRASAVNEDRFLPIPWLLMDHVLLLVQQPVYFTLFRWENEKGPIVQRFSSLCENDRAYWNLSELRHEDEYGGLLVAQKTLSGAEHLRLLCWNTPETTFHAQGSLPVNPLLTWEKICTGACKLLEASIDRGLLYALRLLPPVVDHNITLDAMNFASQHPVSYEDWDDYINAMSTALDPLLSSFREKRLFPPDSDDRARGFFVVTRQPSVRDPTTGAVPNPRIVRKHPDRREARYPYNARVILTPTQIRESKLDNREKQRVQKPLFSSPGARAIADTSLVSGLIDIGVPGEHGSLSNESREHYAIKSDEDKKAVAAAERKVYGASARSKSVFYIPIHLGGIPWLALFTFMPLIGGAEKESPETVWRRYFLYRDLIPILGGQIDEAVMSAYAQTLSDKAVRILRSVSDVESFITQTNAEWQQMALVYPYGSASLERASKEQLDTFALDGVTGQLAIRFKHAQGEYFNYRLLLQERTQQHICDSLKMSAQTIRLQRSRALDGIGHSLKACMELIPDRQLASDLRNAARCGKENADLLTMAADAFDLMLYPRALSYVARQIGVIAGGEKDKLEEPLDDASIQAWRSGSNGKQVACACADFTKALGVVVCRGLGWLSFRISFGVMGKRPTTETWRARDHGSQRAVPLSHLWFPPFRRDTTAVYVVALGILEPMVNAVKTMSKNVYARGSELQACISVRPGHAVDIHIGNYSEQPVGILPSGVDKVAAFTSVTGIVHFDPNPAESYCERHRTQWIGLCVIPHGEITAAQQHATRNKHEHIDPGVYHDEYSQQGEEGTATPACRCPHRR